MSTHVLIELLREQEGVSGGPMEGCSINKTSACERGMRASGKVIPAKRSGWRFTRF